MASRSVTGRTVSMAHPLWAADGRYYRVPHLHLRGATPHVPTPPDRRMPRSRSSSCCPPRRWRRRIDVGGTVTNTDGAPAAGAEVTILVQGTDQILSTTTDESGAWALQLDAEPGAVLEVNGTGQTTTSEPDADGCITTTTLSGQREGRRSRPKGVPPIDFPMDNLLTGTVCAPRRPAGHGGCNGGGARPDTDGGGAHAPADRPIRAARPRPRRTTRRCRSSRASCGVLIGADGRHSRRNRRRTGAAADQHPAAVTARAAAPSIQPSPRVTRRTRSRRPAPRRAPAAPATSRPRSSRPSIAAGLTRRPRPHRAGTADPARRACGPPCRAR